MLTVCASSPECSPSWSPENDVRVALPQLIAYVPQIFDVEDVEEKRPKQGESKSWEQKSPKRESKGPEVAVAAVAEKEPASVDTGAETLKDDDRGGRTGAQTCQLAFESNLQCALLEHPRDARGRLFSLSSRRLRIQYAALLAKASDFSSATFHKPATGPYARRLRQGCTALP